MHGKTSSELLISTNDELDQQPSSVNSVSSLFIDPNTPVSKSPVGAINWTLMLVFVTFVCEQACLLPRDDLKDVIFWLASSLEFYLRSFDGPFFHKRL